MTAYTVSFRVNGREVRVDTPPLKRLTDLLRDDLHLTGTKVGCEAGDCGACTVLLDGAQVCACMVPAGQLQGRAVTTVEGLAGDGGLSVLQQAFHAHGAAQCGICTPGMLMAAVDLLAREPHPDAGAVRDALGGVLCRCTGYQKIVEAVLDAARERAEAPPEVAVAAAPGAAVGARLPKVDGVAKITGAEVYAADHAPEQCLWLRVVRSPHARARFSIGDTAALLAAHPGLVAVLTAADVPGRNGFGIYPHIKDQPVLADGCVRFRGEAVVLLVGDRDGVLEVADDEVPIEWQPEAPVTGVAEALAAAAPLVQAEKHGNVLVRGNLSKGDVETALATSAFRASGRWRTSFVEHGYIEPEAGWARRVPGADGDRMEVFVTTQAPYMDRDETAGVLGIDPTRVRIMPSACGGGFGGKLDVSVQPLLAVAAWHTGQPVRCVWTRPESMASTTKRHPAHIEAEAGCDANGKLTALRFHGDFDTGAYASWGPTVADRVPVHCSGPYVLPNVRATSAAVLTNAPPSGAFRGFGVPQAALAHEALLDMLGEQAGIDPLEFRLRNAIHAGDATATGQVLAASAGLEQCLRAVEPHWKTWRAASKAHNDAGGRRRRGVGIGCMWYGCGNTSISNPSTMRIGISREGRVTLYNGAVDIGQGANTVMVQIAADALGVTADSIAYVMGDTDLTADAGKSSASRQTFVSGKATQLAGEDLRAQILRLTNASPAASIVVERAPEGGRIAVTDGGMSYALDLGMLDPLDGGDVLLGEGRFDPPTRMLDGDGQGIPYGTYAFAAQIAEVEVDVDLGTVRVTRMVAAHDVGRAVNPQQVEGQVHGGIAQGLGFALMEEYLPGRTENLHDYLMPSVGDMPGIEVIIVEDAEPLGPYGAKGIGEPALIPTAPAILAAIHHATGVRIHHLPATPDRVRAALLASGRYEAAR